MLVNHGFVDPACAKRLRGHARAEGLQDQAIGGRWMVERVQEGDRFGVGINQDDVGRSFNSIKPARTL